MALQLEIGYLTVVLSCACNEMKAVCPVMSDLVKPQFQKWQNTKARVHFAKGDSILKLYDKTKMCLYFFLW